MQYWIPDITGLFPGSFTKNSKEGVVKIKVDSGNGEDGTKRFYSSELLFSQKK